MGQYDGRDGSNASEGVFIHASVPGQVETEPEMIKTHERRLFVGVAERKGGYGVDSVEVEEEETNLFQASKHA